EVGEGALSVGEVEVRLGLRRPPGGDQIAVDSGMEPDRGQPVGREEDVARPLGRRQEEAREVDDVPGIGEQDSGEPPLGQVLLQELRPPLVPRERQPVLARRGEPVVGEQGRGGAGAGRGAGGGAGEHGPDRGGSGSREQAAAVDRHGFSLPRPRSYRRAERPIVQPSWLATRSSVRAIMTTVVTHATALNTGPLTESPMSCRRLIRISLKMRTKGSAMPLATWERNMTWMSGNPRTTTTPPPSPIH